jgi:hypothetical protein
MVTGLQIYAEKDKSPPAKPSHGDYEMNHVEETHNGNQLDILRYSINCRPDVGFRLPIVPYLLIIPPLEQGTRPIERNSFPSGTPI